MKINATRRSQAGLTLVEVLLVLAIAAVAIVGGTVLFSQANTSVKTNAANQQLAALVSGINKLYGSQPNYTGLTAAMLDVQNIIPTDMDSAAADDGTMVNAFGGAVTVAVNSGNPTRFDVTFNAVPNAACTQLTTSTGGSTSGTGLAAIRVNGTALTLPVTTANAATNCAASDNNVVIWTYQ